MLIRWPYTLLLLFLLPLVPIRLLWRSIRQPEYLRHWGERFGFYSPVPRIPTLWLHCVSVGETRAAMPLIKLLMQRYPDYQILITHGTPTGRAASEQLLGDEVIRAYLPYDLPFAMANFLDHFQPEVGLLLETELWFNLIAMCKMRDIPLLLVNARLSLRSANGYARLGALSRQALQGLSTIAAQTETDADRLRQLGANSVRVTGNLKFDATSNEAPELGLPQSFGNGRKVFLAASTREGEEGLILDAVAAADIPGLLTIIVPRHPQRFDQVANLLRKRGISFVRRSQLPTSQSKEVAVLLGDSMGEMASYYAACDWALIGGSLLPFGGQNLIEACALGKPVILGVHTFNFEDAASQAVACGAALRVQDASALAQVLQTLANDAAKSGEIGRAGLAFAEANRGAAERTLELVEQFIEPGD